MALTSLAFCIESVLKKVVIELLYYSFPVSTTACNAFLHSHSPQLGTLCARVPAALKITKFN